VGRKGHLKQLQTGSSTDASLHPVRVFLHGTEGLAHNGLVLTHAREQTPLVVAWASERSGLVNVAPHSPALATSTFDFNQSAEAQENGAFDVLDVLHELPKVAEVTKRALWAAYLKGAGPSPDVASSLRHHHPYGSL
jgi:hypothetical protein